MFTKNGITYSEAFHYLKHKRYNMAALQVSSAEADNYTDEAFTEPLTVRVDGLRLVIGGLFVLRVKSLDYADVKMAVIKMRYSNDDQIALILNRSGSEEDSQLYGKMQEWREFASAVANAVYL